MKVKILSCRIFEIYLQELLPKISAKFDYDIEYFEIDQHNYPEKFNHVLQARIDEITGYDLIFLLYGICGNVTKGIRPKTIPLAIPRIHDCTTILLGNKIRYKEVFGSRPSQGWSCASYDNDRSHMGDFFISGNYQELVNKYGEDNAKYLFDTLYPKSENLVYISFGLDIDKKKIQENKLINEVQAGSYEYLKNIFEHEFKDILTIFPGEIIYPVYDNDQVISKKAGC